MLANFTDISTYVSQVVEREQGDFTATQHSPTSSPAVYAYRSSSSIIHVDQMF